MVNIVNGEVVGYEKAVKAHVCAECGNLILRDQYFFDVKEDFKVMDVVVKVHKECIVESDELLKYFIEGREHGNKGQNRA